MTIQHFPEKKKIYILGKEKLKINVIEKLASKNRLKDYSIEEIKNPGIFKGFLYTLKY